MESKLKIIDYMDEVQEVKAVEQEKPLPDGYNLDTIEKARAWLSDPKNWFRSELFVIKWEGLIPKISEKRAKRMLAEPWDDGMPWCVVYGQKERRSKKDRGEELDIKEKDQDE
jgi:hypothetical protein